MTKLITAQDLAELKRKAEAATPGVWRTTSYSGGFSFNGPLTVYCGTDPYYDEPARIPRSDDDALFIAAANPQVVLNLISALEAAFLKAAEAKAVVEAAQDYMAAYKYTTHVRSSTTLERAEAKQKALFGALKALFEALEAAAGTGER